MGIFNNLFLVILVYRIFMKLRSATFDYWQDRNVNCETPWPIFGNMLPLMFKKISLWELLKKWYKMFPGDKYVGVYTFFSPKLIVRNLDVIERIAVTDFDNFCDRFKWVHKKNLAQTNGEDWRNLRCSISPVFSNANAKDMVPLISETAERVVQHFLEQNTKAGFDITDVSRRYANDTMLRVIFGITVNSLVDRSYELYDKARKLVEGGQLRAIPFSMVLSTPIVALLTPFARHVRQFTKRFLAISKECLNLRQSKQPTSPELIQLIQQEKPPKVNSLSFDAGFSVVNELSENGIKTLVSDDFFSTASMQFYLNGFELSSNLICWMSHELGIAPDIQASLQKEIDKTLDKNNGKITYEVVANMKYLDMVVSESLRKYPPCPVFERLCVNDYEMEPETKKKNALIIQKNTTLLIPVVGLHYDPKYFPNPEKFDPERFSEKNKSDIKPFSYLPFGIGPRNCIGSRIALIQIKMFFVHLLSKFTIVSTKDTKKTVEMSVNTFAFVPDDKFYLGIERRTKNFKV